MTRAIRRRTDGKVRKRCERCGTVDWYQPAVKRCRHRKMGGMSYWCYGQLRTVLRKRKEPDMPLLDPKLGLGQVLSEDYQRKVVMQRGVEWRETAMKKLAKAKEHHREWATKTRRAERQMRKWTKTIRDLDKRSKMTDEQVEKVRQRAATAAQVSHVKRRLRNAAGVEEEKKP